MKNIQITLFFEHNEIHSYVSDLLPLVGDSIILDVNKESQQIFIVQNRLFIADRNKVNLIVNKEFNLI